MLEFVMPDLVHTVLGPLKSFQYHFEKAIQVWRKMKTKAPRAKRRAWLLFDLLQNHRLMLRRDSRILDEQLPPKTHIVIRLRMSALQKRLYDAFVRQSSEGNSERSSFDIFAVTSMISDHPVCFCPCFIVAFPIDHETVSCRMLPSRRPTGRATPK